MSTATVLGTLFERDLGRMRAQVESFPTEAILWEVSPGVNNAAGSLVLHVEGNLREFVGRVLGGVAYVRDRPLEFSARGLSRAELVGRLEGVRELVPRVLRGVTEEAMDREYPVKVLPEACSTEEFLVHLYGHLGWHLGQLDYLRRILVGA